VDGATLATRRGTCEQQGLLAGVLRQGRGSLEFTASALLAAEFQQQIAPYAGN